MSIAAYHDNDRVSFLNPALIGRWGKMQLSAVPLAGHQRVVFDNRLLELNHVLLAALDGRREHRLVLHGGVVLRDHRGGGAIECAGSSAWRGVRAVARARCAVGIGRADNTYENGP